MHSGIVSGVARPATTKSFSIHIHNKRTAIPKTHLTLLSNRKICRGNDLFDSVNVDVPSVIQSEKSGSAVEPKAQDDRGDHQDPQTADPNRQDPPRILQHLLRNRHHCVAAIYVSNQPRIHLTLLRLLHFCLYHEFDRDKQLCPDGTQLSEAASGVQL